MIKKALLLGGTGAMGVYLAPELIKSGFRVDITTRSNRHRSGLNVRYIHGDARDDAFLGSVLKERYDVIIDFMVYPTAVFKARVDMLLRSTDRYVFLSTYRVFADSVTPITERSPRLLDVCTDEEYLMTDEYALQKAREEDILRAHKSKNWTIIRPSITYSRDRFQLGVLEAPFFVSRALEGKPTVFPREMLEKQTTMTWAGDVAKMIHGLILNEDTLGEDYNVVTSEHQAWNTIVEYYQDIIGLRVKNLSLNSFLDIYEGKYQVIYDRMYNRVMDNTKVLAATHLRQKDFISLRDGLQLELERFIHSPHFGEHDSALNLRIDNITDSIAQKTRKTVRVRTRVKEIRSRVRIRTRVHNLKHKVRIRTRIRTYRITQDNKKKDGLIITLNSVFNYGNVIQRYALKTVLKNSGYSLDSADVAVWSDEIDDSIFGEPRAFVRKYMGGVKFDTQNLQGYRNYVVGSDQVWRNWYGDDWGMFSPYFLEFVKSRRANKVAYAASFGVDNLAEAGVNEMNIDAIRPLMENFNSISVREESGVKLVKDIIGSATSAKLVLDPTLLLEKSDYSALIDDSDSKSAKTEKVFCYVLDETSEKEQFIRNFSAEYENDYRIFSPKFDQKYEPVEVWLKGFRDSEFVITDSFHGTVFAIINRKDFLVFNNPMRGSARFESLLDSLGISKDRLIDEKSPVADLGSLRAINWTDVDKKLTTLRRDSKKWLIDSLV